MKESSSKQSGSAAERILKVASDLFYRQGYRATGINEVIDKSGVAKATFYSHFKTKDALCKAYLKEMKRGEIEMVDSAIDQAEGPLARFLAVIESLPPWLLETDFRGCGFLNMASEIPDPESPLRKEGMMVYGMIHDRVRALSRALIASDTEKYGHLDPEQLSNDYMVIYAGSVMFAEMYHDIWPVEHALDTLHRLLAS